MPKDSAAKIIVLLFQVFNQKIQGSKKIHFYQEHNDESYLVIILTRPLSGIPLLRAI